jgi:hypothetical protein
MTQTRKYANLIQGQQIIKQSNSPLHFENDTFLFCMQAIIILGNNITLLKFFVGHVKLECVKSNQSVGG